MRVLRISLLPGNYFENNFFKERITFWEENSEEKNLLLRGDLIWHWEGYYSPKLCFSYRNFREILGVLVLFESLVAALNGNNLQWQANQLFQCSCWKVSGLGLCGTFKLKESSWEWGRALAIELLQQSTLTTNFPILSCKYTYHAEALAVSLQEFDFIGMVRLLSTFSWMVIQINSEADWWRVLPDPCSVLRKGPRLRTWSSWGPNCWNGPHLVLILHKSPHFTGC